MHTLGIKYSFTENEAKSKFLKIWEDAIFNISSNEGKRSVLNTELKVIKKACAAYQLVRDDEEYAHYMYTIRLRSFLSQKLVSFSEEESTNFYPYHIFIVMDNEKSIIDDCHKLLELDFVTQTVVLNFKDHSSTSYSMSQILNVIQALNPWEFVIEFSNGMLTYFDS